MVVTNWSEEFVDLNYGVCSLTRSSSEPRIRKHISTKIEANKYLNTSDIEDLMEEYCYMFENEVED